MLNIMWNIISFLLAMGLLITIHEFGHFCVARYFGVKVEQFSIGFGKSLWCYVDSKGTKFIIAIIPLGGYVKMLDEHSSDLLKSNIYQSAFNNKTIIQRASIIFAGPLFNIIFTIFIYWLLFNVGIPGIRPIVGEIIPNSIAAHAEIKPGMEFKAIDGIETPDWDSFRLHLMSKIGNKNIKVSIMNYDTNKIQEKLIDLRSWLFEFNHEDPILSLGIKSFDKKNDLVLSKVLSDSIASKVGLLNEDKIIKVNNEYLEDWSNFVNIIKNNPEIPLTLEVIRNNKKLLFTIIPSSKFINGKVEGFIGVLPKAVKLPDEHKLLIKYNPFISIIRALDKSWQLLKISIQMIEKLIIGDLKLNSISGPISIAYGAGISAKSGIIYYLMFLAVISINLAVINLFPIPMLDGGNLFFLIIEKIKGKPLSNKIQDFSYRIGLIILIILMGFGLLNDFLKFIK